MTDDNVIPFPQKSEPDVVIQCNGCGYQAAFEHFEDLVTALLDGGDGRIHCPNCGAGGAL